jgi:transposase
VGGDLLGRRQARPKPETVRGWVRQAERDEGRRPGTTTDELAELKRLERENAELRRANDILKAAASFFGVVSS